MVAPIITFKNIDGSLRNLTAYTAEHPNLNNFNAPLLIELSNNHATQTIRVASVQETEYKLFNLSIQGQNFQSCIIENLYKTTQIFTFTLKQNSTTVFTLIPCYETKVRATQKLELVNYNFLLIIDDNTDDEILDQAFQFKYRLACFSNDRVVPADDTTNPLPMAIGTKRRPIDLLPPPPPKKIPSSSLSRRFFDTVLNK